MKPPRSLKISDRKLGSGRKVVPGDVAVCHCRCTRSKGDVVFTSEVNGPWPVRVGARDGYVGIEFGLIGMQIGGERKITVPPNLTYDERKTYKDVPEDAMLVYELTLVDFHEKWDPDMQTRLSKSADDPIN